MAYGSAVTGDGEMMALALQQARISLDAGGVPVGAVLITGLAADGQVVAAGHNERVQIVHDELNEASGGIPRKLGFTEIERRPLDHKPLAGTGTGVVWEVTRAQWTGDASL